MKSFPCEYCNATIPVQEKTLQTCPSCRNPCWPGEVKAWSRAGLKINAIKVYRFMTNVGLKEAKDAVEAFPVKGFLEIPPGINIPAAAAPVAAAPAPQSGAHPLEQELRELLQKKGLIEAIKRCREVTGVGLKEAKETVEAIRDGKPYTLQLTQQSPLSPPPTPDVRTEIMAQIQQGQYINAIKLYREATRVGLKEAKDAIDAVRAGQPLSMIMISAPTTPPSATPANRYEAEIQEELRKKNKIAAVKLYREATGLGLKEAKDAVEAFMDGRSPLFPATSDSAPAPVAAPPPPDPNEGFRAELLAVLQSEGFINAIRVYRDKTGVGLKEGKDFIEALEQDPKAPFPVV